jgi:hypothetical protein
LSDAGPVVGVACAGGEDSPEEEPLLGLADCFGLLVDGLVVVFLDVDWEVLEGVEVFEGVDFDGVLLEGLEVAGLLDVVLLVPLEAEVEPPLEAPGVLIPCSRNGLASDPWRTV